jgi:hypothetical protein
VKAYACESAELTAGLLLVLLSALQFIIQYVLESFITVLHLSIGGDITRISGLQIPLSLVEPTVILQARRPIGRKFF